LKKNHRFGGGKMNLLKKMEKYLKNDPDLLLIVCQKKGLRGIELSVMHQVPLINYPAVIDSLKDMINEMTNIYEKEVSDDTKKATKGHMAKI